MCVGGGGGGEEVTTLQGQCNVTSCANLVPILSCLHNENTQ